jgi:hypothetical protein
MDYTTLSQILFNHLDWHPARIKTFAQLTIALIMSGSVTLKHLAQGFQTESKLDSVHRQIQRFLKNQIIDFHWFGMMIREFMGLNGKFYVALDRTNWDFGVFHINFLFITVVFGKVSIPIVWMLLDKKGNSNTSERIDLMRKFLKIIPADQIIALLGDREFIGYDWFQFLERQNIMYVMRIKSNTQMKHKNGGMVDAKLIFAHLKINEYLQMDTKIWGLKVQVIGLKLPNGELLILASTRNIAIDVLEAYRDRWPIERTFLCLKTKGFNFERTHIKDNDKLAKLMAIAVLALSICVKVGAILNEENPIKIKKHGRKLYSLFTYGIDWIKRLLLNKCCNKYDNIKSKILSDTKINKKNKEYIKSPTLAAS